MDAVPVSSRLRQAEYLLMLAQGLPSVVLAGVSAITTSDWMQLASPNLELFKSMFVAFSYGATHFALPLLWVPLMLVLRIEKWLIYAWWLVYAVCPVLLWKLREVAEEGVIRL
jgi:hypothetical protein